MEMRHVIVDRDVAILIAKLVKQAGGDTDKLFRCGSCGEPVRPHGDGFGHQKPRPKECRA